MYETLLCFFLIFFTCMRGDTEKNQKNFSIEPNFFPPEINIRLYDKNSESDYLFFSSTKIRIFFFRKNPLTRYDYDLTIMESPKPATDNRFKK